MRTSEGIEKATEIIRRALKTQDKETRHTCAEASLLAYNNKEDVAAACIKAVAKY